MPTVREILREKDSTVVTIQPEAEVLEAVRKMNQHRIGALVVIQDGQIVGMFTERDVLRLVGALRDLSHLHIRDVMTRDVVVTHANTDLDEVQELMKTRRVRHIPVLDHHAALAGLVSMGDLNAWCVGHQARQLESLNDYIYGRV